MTEPRRPVKAGSAHPITLVMDELIDCFTGLGFSGRPQGPEVELDHYNFELMNLPKNHPARDAQDTFYMDDNIVLRTHTSPMQARAMPTRKPPIRIICPGRVYRADEVDATHSPGVPSDGGAGGGRKRQHVRPARHAGSLRQEALRQRCFHPLPPLASSPSPSPAPRWT